MRKKPFLCLLLLAAACLWGQTDLQEMADLALENMQMAADSVQYDENERTLAARKSFQQLCLLYEEELK